MISNILKYVREIAIIGLILFLAFLLTKPKDIEYVEVPVEIPVYVPAVVDTFPTVKNPEPLPKVVNIPNPVNQELLDKYNKAKDSISKLQIYKDAITENEYKIEYDDSTQTVNVYTKTRGELLEQTVDYHIKPREFVLDTVINVPVKNPIKVFAGVEMGVPTLGDVTPTLKGNILFKNRKDHILSLGVDTRKTVWLGYSIKLF